VLPNGVNLLQRNPFAAPKASLREQNLPSAPLFVSYYHMESFKAAHLSFLFEMEGEDAVRAGRPITANPYDEDSVQGLLWAVGWLNTATLADVMGWVECPVG
jgi:hypothetical protein